MVPGGGDRTFQIDPGQILRSNGIEARKLMEGLGILLPFASSRFRIVVYVSSAVQWLPFYLFFLVAAPLKIVFPKKRAPFFSRVTEQ